MGLPCRNSAGVMGCPAWAEIPFGVLKDKEAERPGDLPGLPAVERREDHSIVVGQCAVQISGLDLHTLDTLRIDGKNIFGQDDEVRRFARSNGTLAGLLKRGVGTVYRKAFDGLFNADPLFAAPPLKRLSL